MRGGASWVVPRSEIASALRPGRSGTSALFLFARDAGGEDLIHVGNDYKQTMNLPQTEFPMRANLSHARAGVARVLGPRSTSTRSRSRRAQGGEPFILHDGPPYANGHIHMGTAYNKVLKDLIVKYKSMRGYYAPYVPGLGLPRPADRAPGREEARAREDGEDLAGRSCASCAATTR